MVKLKRCSWLIVIFAVLALASQPVSAAPRVFPIVDGDTGFLLGGTQNGRWLDAATTAQQMKGGETYRFYTLTGAGKTTVGGKPASIMEGGPCEETLGVELTPKPGTTNALALAADWNPVPRLPRSHSTKSAVYRKAIAEILRANGIKQPEVRLTKILRIDLEGDGVDEVLISATRLTGDDPSPTVSAGDYSLVVLRKLIKNKVVTLTLAAEYYPKAQEFAAPNEYTIVGLLDLNGDGRLEPIVDSQYYEGAATAAYEVTGATVKEVLITGCGV